MVATFAAGDQAAARVVCEAIGRVLALPAEDERPARDQDEDEAAGIVIQLAPRPRP